MIRFDEVFRRHPGVYDLVHDTERPGKKDGSIQHVKVTTHLKITAAEVVRLATQGLAEDPSATFYVWAATRGDEGHIGWIDRHNIHVLFAEVPDGGLELSDEREAPALLPKRKKSVRQVDDPVEPSVPAGALRSPRSVRNVPAEGSTHPSTERQQRVRREPTKLPGDRFPAVRGRPLIIASVEGWPPSQPAQIVRTFFIERGAVAATTAEILAALGMELAALGMAHPGSLISRLKQAGLLKEIE